jgi:tetratricopeptide (TPR) repeat protein
MKLVSREALAFVSVSVFEQPCRSSLHSVRAAWGMVDLDEAIVLDREALGLRPQGHPSRSSSLNNLAVRLSSRYEQLGAMVDLDEAIVLAREALGLCPQGHPNRSMSLSNLAVHLSSRYNQLGAMVDLDEAIVLEREALGLCPQGHPNRSLSLNNLAVHLSSRYKQLGAMVDLDEAIILDREALGLPTRTLSVIEQPCNSSLQSVLEWWTSMKHCPRRSTSPTRTP